MQTTLICCPFKTPFGSYGASLRAAIEKKTGSRVQWIASNCGCPNAMALNRSFLVDQCDYFEMLCPRDFAPHRLAALKVSSGASHSTSKKTLKSRVRGGLGTVLYYFRAKRYAKLAKNANVIHFQQTLEAYGAKSVFHWLNQPSNATRIITVHELDPDQLDAPEKNKTYNLADAIIVHSEDMRKALIRFNVQEEKIHVVPHGTWIPPASSDNHREGIVFYGSYSLTHNKGLDSLFKAMAILKGRMGANAPALKIHGYYSPGLREEATRLAEQHGAANQIVWLDHLSDEETMQLYQHSQVCVLPYTGSFAGRAASLAAACRLPVVCTRKAGLPDHLGDNGVWVEENNPEQLAERVMELLGNDHLRQEIGARLLKRAQDFLSWDVIAGRTLEIYEESARKKETSETREAA
jgi:glycosyltransferase involved in cell wall biosynthesis